MAETKREVINIVKKSIGKELADKKYTVKSSGTKTDELTKPLNKDTGFWENPQSIISKPPRWIVHLDSSTLSVDYAKNEDGELLAGARTIGYINNREGDCSAIVFRTIIAIKNDIGEFLFPDWEWVISLIFNRPFPAGTSGEALTNFDPMIGTITYSKKSYPIPILGVFKTPPEQERYTVDGIEISYDEVTDALKQFLNGDRMGEE